VRGGARSRRRRREGDRSGVRRRRRDGAGPARRSPKTPRHRETRGRGETTTREASRENGHGFLSLSLSLSICTERRITASKRGDGLLEAEDGGEKGRLQRLNLYLHPSFCLFSLNYVIFYFVWA